MSSTLAAQHKVSTTAYDCAAVRAAVYAATRCQSFDYLAADMLRGGTASFRARLGLFLIEIGAVGLARVIMQRTAPGTDVFLFARSAVPDQLARQVLAQDPTTQIILLGAGLDTSALRIGAERRKAGQPEGRFFEVDLPHMQQEKRQQVARARRSHPGLRDDHVTYVSCSFGEHELRTALTQAGFDPSKRALWVWSGVIHYLPEAAVRVTIADLSTLCTSGSQLFFDFILLEAYAQPEQYAFAKTKARFDAFGEVMSFGFRAGEGHIKQWLGEQGLKVAALYTRHDMVALYEQQTGMSAASAGAPWANLCVAEF